MFAKKIENEDPSKERLLKLKRKLGEGSQFKVLKASNQSHECLLVLVLVLKSVYNYNRFCIKYFLYHLSHHNIPLLRRFHGFIFKATAQSLITKSRWNYKDSLSSFLTLVGCWDGAALISRADQPRSKKSNI